MLTSNSDTVFLLNPGLLLTDGSEPKRKAFLIPQGKPGNPIRLDALEMIVGRGEGADIRLLDPLVSRYHARLLSVHNRFYLQDLGSKNSTFLNGYQIENERLAHGDTILIGSSRFQFEIGEEFDLDYLKQLNVETVTSLAEAVDKKDPYTGHHSLAVAKIADRLAIQLGLDSATIERVRIGARLHDIGKIGVPDAVLRKTGSLDEAEFSLIQQHPLDGEAILAPLVFLADVLPAVRSHHERFDGRGYPDGLAGQAISLEARIIKIADAYHAMISARPYREIQTIEYVRQELLKHAGTQFDPELVKAFLSLLPPS